jgi:hypothetical protein
VIAWFKGRDGRVVEVQAAVSWLKFKFPLIGHSLGALPMAS